jgi:hypothetical protein
MFGSGVGAIAGAALTIFGAGLSVVGHVVGKSGGALGGGTAAAWRISRFGLMALIAARPIPLDQEERDELVRAIRQAALDWGRQQEAPTNSV